MDYIAPSIAPPPNACFLLQAKFGRAGGLAKLQGPIVYAALNLIPRKLVWSSWNADLMDSTVPAKPKLCAGAMACKCR